jgi:hypothetical protein
MCWKVKVQNPLRVTLGNASAANAWPAGLLLSFPLSFSPCSALFFLFTLAFADPKTLFRPDP